MARRVGKKVESRAGKNLYIGFVEHRYLGGNETRPAISLAFEVFERLDISNLKITVSYIKDSSPKH